MMLFTTLDFMLTLLVTVTARVDQNPVERCRQKLGISSEKLKILSNIVGVGWDNLRNLPMANVYDTTFYKCKVTPDGMYIVPDNVIVIDVKQSYLDSVASFYESFQDYFHATTDSVNVEVSANMKGLSVSGSFSYEHQNAKQKSVAHSSSIMRTKLQYHAYTLILQPNSPLHPSYKQRLNSIEYYLKTGRHDMATYAAQVLVREFGTHVIKRAKVGAEVSQDDYVDMSVVHEAKSSLDEIKASASANFRDQYKIKMDASHKSVENVSSGYTSSLRHSETHTKGGPDISKLIQGFVAESANVSTPKGAESTYLALDDIVPLDRSGELIYLMVSHRDVEGFSVIDGANVAVELKNATLTYFNRNSRAGCMDPKSQTFDYYANINDSKQCHYARHNYSFGGFIQKCYAFSSKGKASEELCRDQNLVLLNGISGSLACPVRYTYKDYWFSWLGAIIYPADESGTQNGTVVTVAACEPDEEIPERSGYMFGGMYSDERPNPLTGSQTCPGHFIGLQLAFNITVCLSRNYDLDHRYGVEFGGFLTCLNRNDEKEKRTGCRNKEHTSFYVKTIPKIPSVLDKLCPSQTWCERREREALFDVPPFEITATGCEIQFCAKAADFPEYKTMNADRPPYMDSPGVEKAKALFDAYINELN